MATTDIAVRLNGATYRLVATDTAAALFDRTGSQTPLQLVTPATAHGRMPQVLNAAGEPIALQKASKPCSCTGGVWKERAANLRAKL